MASSIDIRGQMEQVDSDLGYSWEDYYAENSVRIGVETLSVVEERLKDILFMTTGVKTAPTP